MYIIWDKRIVKLIDINPLSQITDPMLFSWEELLQKRNLEVPPIRIIEDETESNKIRGGRLVQNAYPIDYPLGSSN